MDPRQLPPCDLVMKGGITSGVVYPGAIRSLARHYRFRQVGGSSAGAIAAAVCAAAELGRQTGRGGGLDQLASVTRDLGRDGFLLGLFKPAPGAEDLWSIVLALVARVQAAQARADRRAGPPGAGSPRRGPALSVRRRGGLAAALAIRASAMALRRAPLALLPVLVAATGGAAMIAGSGADIGWTLLAAIVIALGLAASAAWALVRVLRRTVRALPTSHYGLCTGAGRDGEPALVEWLHGHIQAAAGLDPDGPPLTFTQLEQAGIGLAMTTTDLSYARPVPVPLPAESYLFDPSLMLERFPRPVVRHMVAAALGLPAGSEPPPEAWTMTQWMPEKELPVLVGVRLSLSFPLLLSAMPLHAYWMADSPDRVNLFSDGGICSNFPIHFFDAWFPEAPTFGLDLVDLPGYGSGADARQPRVGDPAGPAAPRWSRVDGLGEFAGQVKDAMQNWRDSLQGELPGFRDRVVQIPLAAGEGGLNLRMTPAQIEALMERGEEAAEVLRESFVWERHRFTRYLTLMQLLQRNLHALARPGSFPGFADALRGGVPAAYPFTAGHGPAWGAAATGATEALLAGAQRWGGEPGDLVDFEAGDLPQPTPAMRIVPPG